MEGLGDILRQMVIRISVDASDTSGFNIVEDRLQNIRQIMTSIKDIGVFLSRTVFTFAKAGMNLESMEIKFGTLAKSMELGKEKLQEMNQFATETPFTLSEVRENTAMLMAMGVSIKDIIPTMTKLGNVTSGLPNMSLERLALNFGQVKSQGYLTGRELRDFAVGGVPIIESLMEMTGKTDATLRDMMKNKQISFEMVNKAFDYMTSKEGRFHKLLEKMALSSEGLYNNIKVTWDLIKEGVGKEVMKDIKPLLKEFKDFLSNNRERIIAKLKNTILSLAKLLVFLYKTVYKVVKSMLPLIEVIAEGLGGILAFTAGIIKFIFTNETFLKSLRIATIVLGVFITGFVVGKIIAFSKAINLASAAIGAFGPVLVAGKGGILGYMKAWALGFGTFIKAALPFLAIGALIYGIFLVLEDMYVYTMGKLEGKKTETYTGDILEGLFKGKEVLRDEIERFVKFIITPFAGLSALLELSWLKIVGTDEEFNAALDKHTKRLKHITDAIKEIDWEGSLERFFGGISDKIFKETDDLIGFNLYDLSWKIDDSISEGITRFIGMIKEKFLFFKINLKQWIDNMFDLNWEEIANKWSKIWSSLWNFDFQKILDQFDYFFLSLIKLFYERFPKIAGTFEKLGLIDAEQNVTMRINQIAQESQRRQQISEPQSLGIQPQSMQIINNDYSKNITNHNNQSLTVQEARKKEMDDFITGFETSIENGKLEYSGSNE